MSTHYALSPDGFGSESKPNQELSFMPKLAHIPLLDVLDQQV